ncbi:MAG: hypothetical protein K2O89_01610 [Clostridia bacterium]|nr:hypothetical protein [Clostridia bacterium]
MKDKRLEEKFEGYFEGVEIPALPNNIVADAKKSVQRRESKWPRFAKIASIAASFVLVFAVAAVLIARADFSAFDQSGAAGDGQTAKIYGVSEVEYIDADAYTLSSVDGSLKFIETLAYAGNADVRTAVTSHFADGETAFAYAQVTLIAGVRYDAEIIVEFTENTFEPLTAYADGAAGNYRGLSYRLTKEIAKNGEPVNKLLVEKGGIKFYFNVQSSDENSYIKCLELLLQN